MPPKAAAASKPAAPAAGKIPGAAPGAKAAKRTTAGDSLSNKPAAVAAARDAPAESTSEFKQLPGKPDKAAHDAEVNELSAQIEKLQKQSVRTLSAARLAVRSVGSSATR